MCYNKIVIKANFVLKKGVYRGFIYVFVEGKSAVHWRTEGQQGE